MREHPPSNTLDLHTFLHLSGLAFETHEPPEEGLDHLTVSILPFEGADDPGPIEGLYLGAALVNPDVFAGNASPDEPGDQEGQTVLPEQLSRQLGPHPGLDVRESSDSSAVVSSRLEHSDINLDGDTGSESAFVQQTVSPESLQFPRGGLSLSTEECEIVPSIYSVLLATSLLVHFLPNKMHPSIVHDCVAGCLLKRAFYP